MHPATTAAVESAPAAAMKTTDASAVESTTH